MQKHMWKIVAGVVILLLGASIVYSQYAANKANEGIEITTHVKGNPDAAVVLVEYSDFQCPACKQFYPYVKDIVDEYGDSLRFEYRHFPLTNIHEHAALAARAAEAAGQQDAFFAMHDMLFENQSTWANSSTPKQYFTQYAEELGLDVDTFSRHMKAPRIANAVDEDFDDARSRGFTGTPTFVLNGEEMQFDSFAEFRSQIEDALGVTASTTATTTSTNATSTPTPQ